MVRIRKQPEIIDFWFAGVSDEHRKDVNKSMDGILVISKNPQYRIFDVVEKGLDLATDLEI